MSMACLTSPSSPNSFQLRLGLKCRKSSLINIRMHARSVDRRIRLFAVSGSSVREEDEGKQGTSGKSWMNSDTTDDAFSGWSETDSSVWKPKIGFGGIVGAGVAGVIVAAGLTFTSLSLRMRNTSGLKQQMEPLTAQQEDLLPSDDQNVEVDRVQSKDIIARPDEVCQQNDCNPESKIGISNDSSSSPEIAEATSESISGDNLSVETSLIQNVGYDSSAIDTIDNASSQEDLQVRPGFIDNSGPPDSNPIPTIPESGMVDVTTNASNLKDPEGVPVAGMAESTFEPEENLVTFNLDNPSVSDSTNLSLEHQEGISNSRDTENSKLSLDIFPGSGAQIPDEPLALDNSFTSEMGVIPDPHVESKDVLETETYLSTKEGYDLSKMVQVPSEDVCSALKEHDLNENGSSGRTPAPVLSNPYANEPDTNSEIDRSSSFFGSLLPEISVSSAGIPAPSLVSTVLQVAPGKVLVPAVVDQFQGQALAALQVLKVIEVDVQPSDLCTRREYARWLVSASSALSRNSASKVYPAMYIENVTELAFDDITSEDPDFTSIQGLAEAGLISSKLSRRDMLQSLDGEHDPFLFYPESPLSRQDLVSWKMALDKRQLPEVDRKILFQRCGFIDIDKINVDAWPALVADQSAGEQGIVALAFGYTRLFQPGKPVTKAQAAIALATGEAADIVSEEVARIEAELMAESAVAAHAALVAQVEKDINASFENDLAMEREKVDAVEKMAREARLELERLRTEREEENNALMRGRASVESEMEVLSRLRREVEEQLQSLMSDKMEIAFERERINKLRKEAENENQSIALLQYELEVERKALSMARAWAEDEAKRAREHAKALEEARDRWERHGIKVIVDNDLREDASAGVTWLSAGKQSIVDETVGRAESLVDKLKEMAGEIRGKSRVVVEAIILKITSLISSLKERAAEAVRQAEELQGTAVSKASKSVQVFQQSATEYSSALMEGAKRIAGDWREGVERISQKFKA